MAVLSLDKQWTLDPQNGWIDLHEYNAAVDAFKRTAALYGHPTDTPYIRRLYNWIMNCRDRRRPTPYQLHDAAKRIVWHRLSREGCGKQVDGTFDGKAAMKEAYRQAEK